MRLHELRRMKIPERRKKAEMVKVGRDQKNPTGGKKENNKRRGKKERNREA